MESLTVTFRNGEDPVAFNMPLAPGIYPMLTVWGETAGYKHMVDTIGYCIAHIGTDNVLCIQPDSRGRRNFEKIVVVIAYEQCDDGAGDDSLRTGRNHQAHAE